MFEHFKQELILFEKLLLRLVRFYFIATGLLLFALLPGIAGFYWVEDLSLKQATVNALSILGTIDPPYSSTSNMKRTFTAVYGLFAETVFLLSLAILLAPVIHRILHKFHVSTD
jgi:hypothetical protein